MKPVLVDQTPAAPAFRAASPLFEADIWTKLPRPLNGPTLVAAALAVVALATLIGVAVAHLLPQPSVPLVYLLFVVLTAISLGTWTGVTAAFLAFLAYNFFFIQPIYTFVIADPQELFALIVFFIVALLTGSLAGRMREVADASRRRANALLALNEFAALLSGARSQAAIMQALATQVATTVQGSTVVMTADGDDLAISAAVPSSTQLTTTDLQAASRARRSGSYVPAAAPGWPGPTYEFRPLTTDRGVIAVVGFTPANGQRAIARQDEGTLQTILRHAAIAIERIRFEAEGAAARDEAEREQIRSALLSSLSHDLRTPLASILGAVTSLRLLGEGMTAETRADLLLAIEEETGRLSQFVVNLLDLTRLETEAPDLRRDWLDVADVAQVAAGRARHLFCGRDIVMTAEPAVPLVRGDAMLFEHVVINLIDNAVKYSGAATRILLSVKTVGNNLQLTVTDQGRGIPPDHIEAVFKKFYRVRAGDRDTQGTGLGLTICKRVVEQMGGTIHAESPVEDN
ncbi:MAG: DUF4118 domain-containing protein, partial [Hyphomicrobiaceae bacterium]